MLNTLNNDMFCYLMSLLTFKDICNVSVCCKRLRRRIYESGRIWKDRILFVTMRGNIIPDITKAPLFMLDCGNGPKFDVSDINLYALSVVRNLCLYNKNVINIPDIYKRICSTCNKMIDCGQLVTFQWKPSCNYSDFIHKSCRATCEKCEVFTTRDLCIICCVCGERTCRDCSSENTYVNICITCEKKSNLQK